MALKQIRQFNDFNSEEEIIESIQDLYRSYENDPHIFQRLERVLSSLHDNNLYPFAALDVIYEFLPTIAGQKGSKYIIYALREGIHLEEHINPDLLFELKMLVSRYGIHFVSSERYIENPLNYSALQLGYLGNNNLCTLRILRADNKALELSMDIPTLIKFASHTLQKVSQVIDHGKMEIEQNDEQEILRSMFRLMKSLGVIDDETRKNS